VLALVALGAAGCPRHEPSPTPEPAQPPIAEGTLPPTGAPEFAIEGITSTRSDDGRELYVEGLVRNTGSRASRDVKVWVDGVDARGTRLARAEAFPSPQIIPPGSSGRFVVRFPNDEAIRSFKVEAIGR
jgi:hypothetical protein